MNTPLLLKEKLFAALDLIQSHKDGSPLTNVQLDKSTAAEIEDLTVQLESCNPNPNPLVNAISLLEGTWQLKYSTEERNSFFSFATIGVKAGSSLSSN